MQITSVEEYRESLIAEGTKRLKQINEFLYAGKEEEAANLIDLAGNFGPFRSAVLLSWKLDDFQSKEILFRLIIDVYTNDGYRFPKYVIQKAKQLKKMCSGKRKALRSSGWSVHQSLPRY